MDNAEFINVLFKRKIVEIRINKMEYETIEKADFY
jgi:hypothetical protein